MDADARPSSFIRSDESGPDHDSLRTVPLVVSDVVDWPPPPRQHDTTAHGQARRWGTGTMLDAFDNIHVCVVALEGSDAGQLPETVTRPWITLCERVAMLDRSQPVPASVLNTGNLTELARLLLIHLSRDRRTRDIPYEARRQRR
ncbi:hypothetical protein BC940DRAFT_323796 [Gongronella butleri]|nr:hypothetical protein BC940DRAFT_323796 [Gongronella butleri]